MSSLFDCIYCEKKKKKKGGNENFNILAKFYEILHKLTHSPIHHFQTIPKFKEVPDDNSKLAVQGFQHTDGIENIVGKGEIAHFEQFHFFPQNFPEVIFFNVLK